MMPNPFAFLRLFNNNLNDKGEGCVQLASAFFHELTARHIKGPKPIFTRNIQSNDRA
jgi:hypothetical protein